MPRLRAIPWKRAIKTNWKPEAKVGRPRLDTVEATHRRIAVQTRVAELLTGRLVTFRLLMELADAYESEIREALRSLGVVYTRVPGCRLPIYTIRVPAPAPALHLN